MDSFTLFELFSEAFVPVKDRCSILMLQVGLNGMDLWIGRSLEHLTVLKIIQGAAHEVMRQDRDLYVLCAFCSGIKIMQHKRSICWFSKMHKFLILRLHKSKKGGWSKQGWVQRAQTCELKEKLQNEPA